MPHSLTAARLKKGYYGLDLPVVTDEIAPIAKGDLDAEGNNLVSYHGIDVTSSVFGSEYDSSGNRSYRSFDFELVGGLMR